MNQVRNLIINIIINIAFNILIFNGIVLLTQKVFKESILHSPKIYFAYFLVSLLVLIISTILSMWFSATVADHRFKSPSYVMHAPISGFIIINYIFSFIRGNTKMVKGVGYNYFSRLSDDEVIVYRIGIFYIAHIGSYDYHGSQNEIEDIKNGIEEFHLLYQSKPIKKPNKAHYQQWDGTLDSESKRMDTIKNILK